MFIIIAILGFVTITALGLALAGGDPHAGRVAKRTQSIASGGVRDVGARGKAVANTPDARRKQILKTLKAQDRQQKKASLSLTARLRQAGLGEKVQAFWIISGVIAVTVFLLLLLLRQTALIALGAAFAAGGGLPRWWSAFWARPAPRSSPRPFPTPSTSSCAASSRVCRFTTV